MNPDAPLGPRSRSRLRSRSRSPLWVGTSLALIALACFLIAVAAGLISDNVKSSVLATTVTATPSATQATSWAHPTSYLGRYHVDEIPGSQRVGDLTLFLRTIKSTEPQALSGILSLSGDAGDQLVYLTGLTSRQGALHAEINGGSYFGPVIGSFTGVRSGTGLAGTLALSGAKGLEVRMTRYAGLPPTH